VVIILATVPLVAFLATCLIVAVSGRARTMQDAQGAAVLIMLQVIMALLVAQSSGKLLLHVPNALLGSAILLVIDVALFKVVVGRFQRERIVTRLSAVRMRGTRTIPPR
jgi:ABC-2 type transport system permease protein